MESKPGLRMPFDVQLWQRNLYIVFAVEIASEIGFGVVSPFLPFYFQDLGVKDPKEVAYWVGLVVAGHSVLMAVMAPLWGMAADRYGRKLMLVRALVGGGVMSVLAALVVSAPQLAFFRILDGVLVGATTASTALVAVTTPREHVAKGMGLLQTGILVGGSLGPLAGGIIGSTLGYRVGYLISGVLLIAVGIAVALLVKEDFVRPAPRDRGGAPVWAALRAVTANSLVLTMISLLALSSFAVTVSDSFLALYVQTLVPTLGQAAEATGVIVALTTLASAVGALAAGRAADRLGRSRVLIVAVGIGALSYLPQGLTQRIWPLLVLRILTGLAMGGVGPVANAVIAEGTPKSARGSTYGVGASINAVGRALGPTIGASLVAAWSVAAVFPVTGLVLGLAAVLAAARSRALNAFSPES